VFVKCVEAAIRCAKPEKNGNRIAAHGNDCRRPAPLRFDTVAGAIITQNTAAIETV